MCRDVIFFCVTVRTSHERQLLCGMALFNWWDTYGSWARKSELLWKWSQFRFVGLSLTQMNALFTPLPFAGKTFCLLRRSGGIYRVSQRLAREKRLSNFGIKSDLGVSGGKPVYSKNPFYQFRMFSNTYFSKNWQPLLWWYVCVCSCIFTGRKTFTKFRKFVRIWQKLVWAVFTIWISQLSVGFTDFQCVFKCGSSSSLNW